MYLTAWATEDGRIHFRPDIYHLDDTGFVHGPAAAARRLLAPFPATQLGFLEAVIQSSMQQPMVSSLDERVEAGPVD